MPGPFPGMDPYLESPSHWGGLHDLLIASTVAQLQPKLMARGYYANPGERVWLTEPRRPIYPDVAVIVKPRSQSVMTTTTAVVDEPVRVRQASVQIREPFIEIFDAEGDRLVTGIEFISPWNKSHRRGRGLYKKKQRESQEAGIHLVEIDLLRGGPRIAMLPRSVLESQPRHDYLINIVRADSIDHEFYLRRVRDRLPRIGLPLNPGDADQVLDLQSVFDQSYDTGPYRLRIDYHNSPEQPLPDDDAAWAEQVLKEKGLR